MAHYYIQKKKNITQTNLDNVIASVSVLNYHLKISKNIITTLILEFCKFRTLDLKIFLIKMESRLY